MTASNLLHWTHWKESRLIHHALSFIFLDQMQEYSTQRAPPSSVSTIFSLKISFSNTPDSPVTNHASGPSPSTLGLHIIPFRNLDHEAQQDSVLKACQYQVIELRNSLKYRMKHTQMSFSKKSSSNHLGLGRRVVLMSYEGQKVETFYA